MTAAATGSGWVDLCHGHRKEAFASSPWWAFPRANTATHRVIHCHIAGKSRAFGRTNGTTKAVPHRPCGRVGANPPSGGGAFLPKPRSSVPSGAKPQRTIRCVAFSGDGRSCQPLQNPFDGTLCTTTDHLSCAIPCRQNLQDRKSRLARAASPDNRDPQQQQETSRGNRRGPWVVLTSLRPSLECRIRHPRTLASPHLSGYPTNVIRATASKPLR